MTEHAITIRPICFSAKTYAKLPKELQDAVVKAGAKWIAIDVDWKSIQGDGPNSFRWDLGLDPTVIAARLHISERTASNYATTVRKKLGASSIYELRKYAEKHGLLAEPPALGPSMP